MLLDGDLSLTERVPLELHVNTCGECRQKLADLQIVKVVEEKTATRPVHDWRPSLAHWRLMLAHWRPTLNHWRPTLNHWRPTLNHWRPTFGHWRPTLGHWRPTLGHWRPTPGHWRPTLSTGLVGKAIGVIRTDDAAARLRRFVVERFERFPPRHLAAAAAVPLVITLAIFVFERGFVVGTSIRQRPSSAPTAMRNSPPPAVSTDPGISALSPPAPALPRPSTPSQSPAARTQAQPPRAIPTPKATEAKAVEKQAMPRSPQTESSVKQARAESTAASKPAPARAAPGQPAETVRKESLAAARAVPGKGNSAGADVGAAASASRRGTVDVVGRLQVKSRSEAERDLAALLSRAGGTSVRRQRGPAVTVVEAAVPHASYGKFSQGLGRLGSWRLEAERSPLPDLVQVSVRLAE